MKSNSDTKPESYSLSRIFLHWAIAFAVIALFISGIWMVELDYYNQWYSLAPYWHKSIGLLLLPLLIFSAVWRIVTTKPAYENSVSRKEQLAARFVHLLMSMLILIIIISGYLITTATGESVSVFNWFEVPAVFNKISGRFVDFPGDAHRILAYILIGLALLHAWAAIYHHVIKNDRTLLKMLRK